MDGICVTVNLVHVSLSSLAFTASFQMSRIVVESRGPAWQRATLPHTRIKDLERGEVTPHLNSPHLTLPHLP